jgi:hypothetical protein
MQTMNVDAGIEDTLVTASGGAMLATGFVTLSMYNALSAERMPVLRPVVIRLGHRSSVWRALTFRLDCNFDLTRPPLGHFPLISLGTDKLRD